MTTLDKEFIYLITLPAVALLPPRARAWLILALVFAVLGLTAWLLARWEGLV